MTISASVRNLLTYLDHEGVRSEYTGETKQIISTILHSSSPIPVLSIGSGSCASGAGAAETELAIRGWLNRENIEAEILRIGCLGLCSEEPLLDIRLPGRTRLCFRKATADTVDSLLTAVLKQGIPPETGKILGQYPKTDYSNERAWDGIPFLDELPFFRKQSRFVLKNCGVIAPDSIGEYLARGGYRSFALALHTMTPTEICEAVTKSGLRGRGGAGFPTGKKWLTARNTPSDKKYLICNADEGDPGAFICRTILESDPHSVIEGLAIAAYAIGASRAYIYIRPEYTQAEKVLSKAIAEAREAGLLGENILDSGVDLNIRITKGAGAFVCGEETALIHCIEGKRGMPRPRPPYPAESGLFGKPTVINNVETLANIPGILHPDEARSALPKKDFFSAGTKIFALSGKIKHTGLVEVPFGTTAREMIFEIGGGVAGDFPFKAVQIGGPSGGCLPESKLDLPLDYETLDRSGAMIGSGGIVTLDTSDCMVDIAKFFMDFMRRESCGKCVPCREGIRQLCMLLDGISKGRASGETVNGIPKELEELGRLSKIIQETSLCGLGRTAPNPVLSTLKYFRSEYEKHLSGKGCPVGICIQSGEQSL